MKNIIIIAVLVAVIGFAVFYIYKSKKSGKGCIGCPDSVTCGKSNSGGCSGGCSCCCGKENS